MTPIVTISPDPQRRAALRRANEIRLARAEIKRGIARGEVSVAEIILASPEETSSWAVWDLLICQRRWGASRCRKFLAGNHISETKQIGQLTERQRAVLAAQLQEHSV